MREEGQLVVLAVPGHHHLGLAGAPLGDLQFAAFTGQLVGPGGHGEATRWDRRLTQSGTTRVLPFSVIASPAAGVLAMAGTLAAVSAGAAPGTPPRGVVRNTWLGGSGVPFFKWA